MSLACQDALESVGQLVFAGIQVPVVAVGLGPESGVALDDSCLDMLSHAGNAAASPGKPGYFTLDQLPAIRRLLTRAIGGGELPSCLVQPRIAIAGMRDLEVRLDDKVLKRSDPDGWALEPGFTPPAVRLQGAACDAAMNLQALTVNLASGEPCPGVTAM